MSSVLKSLGYLVVGIVVVAANTPGASADDLGYDPAIQSVGSDGKLVTSASGKQPPATPRAPGLAGWSSPQLVATYYDWDNWDLNGHIGLDDLGNIHTGNRLWEYDNQVLTYDRWAFDPGGESLGEWLGVYGIGDGPAFTDFVGGNFAMQPSATTQWFALVDDSDNVHLFSTSSIGGTGWELIYRKLDSAGNELIPWKMITYEGHPWNFFMCPFIKHDGTIGVIWLRDTEDIVCTTTTDGGTTWSIINTLIDRGDAQGTGLNAVVADDDSMHIVWRVLDWSTTEEGVWYAKLRSDFSVAVGETKIYDGVAQYPKVVLDKGGWLHVMWHLVYDVSTQLYYTKLRGDLDLDGAPSTDAELTLTQELAFVTDAMTVRYPIGVATDNKIHIIYESGTYGRDQDKNLYYMTLSPVPADMNCDGNIDMDDVTPFVLALVDSEEFATQYYGCEPIRADVNGDTLIDGRDISDFLDILLQADDE